VPRHSGKPLFFVFFLFFVWTTNHIYRHIHKSTPIYQEPHLWITNKQICLESTIYYKPSKSTHY
jgi:hypothetical protein